MTISAHFAVKKETAEDAEKRNAEAQRKALVFKKP
jgi:hypothetical protein